MSQEPAGRHLVFVNSDTTSEDDEMTDRMNLFETELGAKFAKRFANASMLIAQSTLPKTTMELVSIRASQINGCGHCIDMHTKDAAAGGETPTRINLVATWREATVYTEAEQAALAFAEEGTRLADAYQGVSDETWAWASKHYDEDEMVALVLVVSLINAANRMAVLTHTKGGSYEPGQYASMMS
jgi:AhpD family alkylhydroperoxidase